MAGRGRLGVRGWGVSGWGGFSSVVLEKEGRVLRGGCGRMMERMFMGILSNVSIVHNPWWLIKNLYSF
jgi:hypothetical protein